MSSFVRFKIAIPPDRAKTNLLSKLKLSWSEENKEMWVAILAEILIMHFFKDSRLKFSNAFLLTVHPKYLVSFVLHDL
jgi:hypothetical protein